MKPQPKTLLQSRTVKERKPRYPKPVDPAYEDDLAWTVHALEHLDEWAESRPPVFQAAPDPNERIPKHEPITESRSEWDRRDVWASAAVYRWLRSKVGQKWDDNRQTLFALVGQNPQFRHLVDEKLMVLDGEKFSAGGYRGRPTRLDGHNGRNHFYVDSDGTLQLEKCVPWPSNPKPVYTFVDKEHVWYRTVRGVFKAPLDKLQKPDWTMFNLYTYRIYAGRLIFGRGRGTSETLRGKFVMTRHSRQVSPEKAPPEALTLTLTPYARE